MAYKLKPETPEEAEELIQRELTKFDTDVDNCSISMTKRAHFTQAAMSYYLYNSLITQNRYFEYHEQLLSGVKKALNKCICNKR